MGFAFSFRFFFLPLYLFLFEVDFYPRAHLVVAVCVRFPLRNGDSLFSFHKRTEITAVVFIPV